MGSELVQAALSAAALWSALLALLIIGLAANISYLRITRKVSLGDHGDRYINRALRAHGNAVEFIPLALVLLFSYAVLGGSAAMIHIFGGALFISRIAHAWGMLAKATTLRRQIGAFVTYVIVIVLAVLNLIAAFS